ncbi:MAG: cytochrome C [Pseudomonadota bacterium]
MKAGKLLLLTLLTAPLVSGPVSAQVEELVREQCASCHQLKESGAPAGADSRLERIAPPLHYAGNKFRRDWLVAWLQQPERLRPAGYYPAVEIVSSEEGDIVDLSTLPEHPELDGEQARRVADHLMGLTSRQALIDADDYEPGTVARRMGMMDFRRFKGCDACHQDAPDSGGVSGPRLDDAWQRLQPAYMSSFIADPAAWDEATVMPVPSMNEAAVHRLVHYLRTIGGDS